MTKRYRDDIPEPPPPTAGIAARLAWLRMFKSGVSIRSSHRASVICDLAPTIDPRWLLTGHISPAAENAITLLRSVGYSDPSEQAVFALEVLLQPSTQSGVCRYCGCNDIHGCEVGCSWLDGLQTICSACVEVPGGH